MDWRKAWKKTWYFIWESDSVMSWIVNIILAFVLIKFLVYPGLGLVMDTSHPIVAVVSGSMEHKAVHPCKISSSSGCIKKDSEYYQICGKRFDKKQENGFDFFWENCGDWYEKNTDISKTDFSKFRFKNGFNTGDIMVLKGVEASDIVVGDTIVYISRGASYPIIHRVIDIEEKNRGYMFTTKGDHNSDGDASIDDSKIIGKAVSRVPLLGWIKIGAVKLWRVFV